MVFSRNKCLQALAIICMCLVLETRAQTMDPRAQELYREVMNYRAQLGLPSIPQCSHLNTVAEAHVADLQGMWPNGPPPGPCNMHSWSSCCYTGAQADLPCMWNKPRELTAYTGNGYENAHGQWGTPVTPRGAMNGWANSPLHRDVILNQGQWWSEWRAIGVGISENYAVLWFGREECPP